MSFLINSKQMTFYHGYEMTKVVSFNEFKTVGNRFESVTQLDENRLLLADISEGTLTIMDFEGNFLESFNPDGKLNDPLSTVINWKKEILVGDANQLKVNVFNEDFKYLREFGAGVLQMPNYLKFDVEQKDVLYISHYVNNKISIWINECYIEEFEVESPLNIEINKEKLFVVSSVDFEVDNDTSELKTITRGLNCIFVFCKFSLNVIQTIQLDNWLNPEGIYLDQYMNIYTLAYELTDHQYVSKYRHLFMIDENGNCIKKISFDGLKHMSEMIVVDNKIFCCGGDNKVRAIEFE